MILLVIFKEYTVQASGEQTGQAAFVPLSLQYVFRVPAMRSFTNGYTDAISYRGCCEERPPFSHFCEASDRQFERSGQ